jgi:hypothetical protein
VLYAPGATVTGETSWQQNNPIAWDVRTMVVNGVLGTWDTTQIPNGQYVLALVMFEVGNDTPMVFLRQQPDREQRGGHTHTRTVADT